MEKVLRINVGAENGPVATIEELGAYAGLGGRAMTTTVVCNEVPPNCHPLGPENKLVFSPGLMAGSARRRRAASRSDAKARLRGPSRNPTRAAPAASSWPALAMRPSSLKAKGKQTTCGKSLSRKTR